MYLGLDIGSVSIKSAVVDDKGSIIEEHYIRTKGNIIAATKDILGLLKTKNVTGIATTGSARKFISALITADVSVDEITAHRTAVSKLYPKVRTIFEIGGQDSKIIYFNDRNVNFEMNNVCAAGTGSFLDQQAARLGLDLKEFCRLGLSAKEYHKIASKCTVFAETDMIHAQQSGVPLNKVIRGVHRGMVNNYFSQLCRGKTLEGAFLFEGGTSENPVLVQEFSNKLIEIGLIKNRKQLIVPKPHNKTMGAIGAAMICLNKKLDNKRQVPKIKEYEVLEGQKCNACNVKCGSSLTSIKVNGKVITIGRQCKE
ncbi:MAG: acyl-CoA dehydratase activase [Nanoarchaeota archaeon]|nr:acyl-CoA dehydratase activase [Nanoarchaeota archaeon]